MQKGSGIGSTGPSDSTVVRMPVIPLYSSLGKRWKQQKERRKTRQGMREIVCFHEYKGTDKSRK